MSESLLVTAGIDVGSAAVKAVVMASGPGDERILARAGVKIRKRDVTQVVDEAFGLAAKEAGAGEIAYVATTGEGEDVAFATGHFFGMTSHARGALFLSPGARAVVDVGALHARAMATDGQGRVLRTKMTSQCASGSGQFLENIARYLGVPLSDVGAVSLEGKAPELVSSICAVLAETDVINMVSRGIATADILRGIHESMAGRLARLLLSIGAGGTVFLSGGLSADVGLRDALSRQLSRMAQGAAPPSVVTHELAAFSGAIGAALWGAFRHRKLRAGGQAWTARATA